MMYSVTSLILNMFKKALFTIIILIVLLSTAFSQGKWELKRNENGIEVFTRTPLTGNLKELRVICELTTTKTQLIKTLQDIKHYNDWVYNTRKTAILKTVNSKQIIFYSVSHLPWPIKDRDLIVQLSLLPDSITNRFEIQAKSLPDYLPKNPDIIRVPYSLALWKVIVVDDHTLKVDYTFSVNPGGNLPAWLVNTTLAIGPYNSFMDLRDELKKAASK
ncbi:MAG: hypothetical protein JWP71_778 [Mucilaginibacter sp.]|nr:hypothetical protein [Mucilaginibacter sp.]